MTFNIIPAIDILDQSVVRLTQGRYDCVDHFHKSPEDIALEFEQQGANRIHLVDLNGAKEGDLVNFNVLKKIRDCVNCDLQIGGGIRSIETAQKLFDHGINYLILGSLLVKSPELAHAIILKFPNKIIAGIDLKGEHIATEGWEDTDSSTCVSQLLADLNPLPIAGIISTDIEKDGMMQGPGIHSLKQLSQYTQHPIIASGGVSSLADIVNLKSLHSHGINGCIIGKALLSGQLLLSDALAL